jgi:peptidyl-Asp metalloendopeptidase
MGAVQTRYSAILQLGIAAVVAALVALVSSPALALNVAASANGAVASASSTHSAGFSADGAIDGDRKGLNWGSDGGWNDGTSGVYPDSLQVNFSGTFTINRIDIFTVQDNFSAPVEPTPLTTFTQWGITAFQVQYWNGSTWLDIPGANITGNNRVWRTIAFAPVATSAIRVLVNGSLNRYSRVVELEAWTAEASNVASQRNGGIASASSTHSAGYAAGGANNGDRKGLSWGSGGGWNDGTSSTYPDFLQVNFNGTYTINEVDVFTLQDDFAAPVEPTLSTTFTQWGITAFQVQYWNGSTWLDIPGGNITGNNRVWRAITFSPVSTSAIRVLINDALNRYSRITEVEAWTVGAGNTSGNSPQHDAGRTCNSKSVCDSCRLGRQRKQSRVLSG